ncbi:FAR1 domain-containing protein [Citrus sinensis]|nr:FAR1 domain-containing protein [Citrus sinensis]
MTEGGELIDFYDGRELIVNEADRHAERSIGMEFESEEAAMAYYDAYAKCVGFIRVGNCHHSSRDESIYNFSTQDERDEIIGELSTDLHCTNQQLAECWQLLEMVLKHVEWHTDHITKSIQNIIENVKDVEAENEER